MRAVRLAPQPGCRRLEHHPHAGRDRLEPGQILPTQHPGVEVRQQTGLLEHQDRHCAQVLQGACVAALVQPLLRLGPAFLRPVAQGEQRLLAAVLLTLFCDRQDLIRAEVRRLHAPRGSGKRAVVAAVATQPGQWDEHLAAVRHRPAVARVADPAGRRTQVLEVVISGVQQDGGLDYVEGHPVAGASERAAHCIGARRCHPSDPKRPERRRGAQGRVDSGDCWRICAPGHARTARISRTNPPPVPDRRCGARATGLPG